MKVLYEDGRWVARTIFSEKDTAKASGMQWNRQGSFWSGDAGCAQKLRDFVDASQLDLLDQHLALLSVEEEARAAAEAAAKQARLDRELQAVASSRATDSDLEIPAPDGLAYLGYQKAGIAYAMARPQCLIADEPGLGKTIQALGLCNVLLRTQPRVRLLVVAPKIAMWNWRRESEKWLTTPHTVALWTSKDQPDADVVIVNYDILAKLHDQLRAREWDVVVFDEAQALKNEKAARTVQALGHWRSGVSAIPAKRRLFLTGTPILNRPIELYPVLHAVGFAGARSYRAFAERYCAGKQTRFGYDADGASHLDELQERLRAGFMVRRLKKDVLTDLAPKRYSVVELAADTPALRRAVAAERAAHDAYESAAPMRSEARAARESGDEKRARAILAAMRAAKVPEFDEISRLRHETAVAKIPSVVEHVAALLDGSDESILVMAHHRDVIEGVVAGLSAAGHEASVIHGDTSPEDRQAAQDQIQNRVRRVFVGSMRACGVAITLSAASTVVFAEQDWTPGTMTQAEDRAHRIGQQGSVLVQHLVVDGSIDVAMAKAVGSKASVIHEALDAVPEPVAVEEPEVVESPVAVTPVTETAPKRRGRPSRSGTPMSQVERNRIYRQSKAITDIAVPAAIAERLRLLREARGVTNAELLEQALSLLESSSLHARDDSVLPITRLQ